MFGEISYHYQQYNTINSTSWSFCGLYWCFHDALWMELRYASQNLPELIIFANNLTMTVIKSTSKSSTRLIACMFTTHTIHHMEY
jgi:hypothetical protein